MKVFASGLIATGVSRANGQVKKIMNTLKNLLTVVSNNDNLDKMLWMKCNYHCTHNRVTGASLLQLLIGQVAQSLNFMMIDDEEKVIDLTEVRNRANALFECSVQFKKQRFYRC